MGQALYRGAMSCSHKIVALSFCVYWTHNGQLLFFRGQLVFTQIESMLQTEVVSSCSDTYHKNLPLKVLKLKRKWKENTNESSSLCLSGQSLLTELQWKDCNTKRDFSYNCTCTYFICLRKIKSSQCSSDKLVNVFLQK